MRSRCFSLLDTGSRVFSADAPHISLGVGKINPLSSPLIKGKLKGVSFYAKCIALCQLGNYCTVQKILQTYKLPLLLITIHYLTAVSMLWALPNYRSMIRAKKGIAVNCTLCHLSDSWELNKYGKDFSKEGRSLAAIELLDQKDSDGDGFINLQEWKALSNPGDFASTPKRPGHWLKEIKPTLAPKKVLAPFFSKDASYRVQEEPLSEKIIQEVEKTIRKKLADEEKFPTVFWIMSKEKRIGAATYLTVPTKEQKKYIYLLVVDREKIIQLHPVLVESRALKSKGFLHQFENKTREQILNTQASAEHKKDLEELVKKIQNAIIIIERLWEDFG